MGIICSYFLLGIAIVTDNVLFPNLPKNIRTDTVKEIMDIIIIILAAMLILIFMRIVITNFKTQLIIIAQKYSVKLLASIAGISILGELFLFIIASLVKEPSEKILSPILAFAFSSLLVPCLKYLQNMPFLKVEVFNRLNDTVTWDDYVNITACWHGKTAKRVSFLGFCIPEDLGIVQEHGEGFEKRIIIPNYVHSLDEVIEPNQYGLRYSLKLSDIECDHKKDSLIAIYTDTDTDIFFKEFKIMKTEQNNKSKKNKKADLISVWLFACGLVLAGCVFINWIKLSRTDYYSTVLLGIIACILWYCSFKVKNCNFTRTNGYITLNLIIIFTLGKLALSTWNLNKFSDYCINYLSMIVVIMSIGWMLHYGIEYFSKCHKHFIWSFYEKIIQVCLNHLENDDEFKEDLIKDLKKK